MKEVFVTTAAAAATTTTTKQATIIFELWWNLIPSQFILKISKQ